jgi:hypothetical protein
MEGFGTRSIAIGLKVARALLLLSAFALLLLWTASLPEYFRRVSTLSIPTFERAGEVQASNEMIEGAAALRGLSLGSYLIYDLGLSLLSIGVFFGVAGLLVWRAKRSWFGWLTALVLIGIGTNEMTQVLHVVRPPAGILLTIEAAAWLVWPVMFLWIYLFPSGGAAPRWTRTPVGIILACLGILTLAGFLASFGGLAIEAERLLSQTGPVIGVGMLGLIVYSQIYRYRHVYSSVEREQVKWFVFAIVVLLAQIILFVSAGVLGSQPSAVFQDLSGEILLVLPLSVGVAALRYRLYDIDLVINRTLVYGTLTVLLAAVYFGGVAVLQAAFRALAGQGSPLAIVLSTLAIATVFFPLRRRIQAFIDHRFYRRKYDAQRALASFGTTARDEVELERLAQALVGVVDETMQPAQVTLWVREQG